MVDDNAAKLRDGMMHKSATPSETSREAENDPCPDCGTQLVAQWRGGVKCPSCPYWFCY